MTLLQPVLEIQPGDGFALWPVATLESYSFLPLNGEFGSAEVGTAVMSIAAELRRLLAEAEPGSDRLPPPRRCLGGPMPADHAAPLTAALARALALPVPEP